MKRPLLSILLIVLVASALSCVQTDEGESGKQYVSFESAAELRAYLRWHPDRTPLIGAHRGGPAVGFPENCIATFERALGYAPCLIECDVRKSEDGELVLLHDAGLDRTTTGQGDVGDLTLTELQELALVDESGTVTEYRIPTLAEALRWADGKTILELDVKSPVTPEEIVEVVDAHGAQSHTIVIVYDWRGAETYHALDDDLLISCSARGLEGVDYMLQSSVPPENLLAWIGVSEPAAEVYERLHQNGIRAILGTIGNLDRSARTRGLEVYLEVLRNGADILATDEVEMVAEALDLYAQETAGAAAAR